MVLSGLCGEPYSGIAFQTDSTGKKTAELNYKDGKKHGLHTEWDESGNKTEKYYENREEVPKP